MGCSNRGAAARGSGRLRHLDFIARSHALTANGLSVDTQTKIRHCDAVIALITSTAQAPFVSLVNNELQAAAQVNKPVIALIEQGVPIKGLPDDRIVYFNRFDPTAHEKDLKVSTAFAFNGTTSPLRIS